MKVTFITWFIFGFHYTWIFMKIILQNILAGRKLKLLDLTAHDYKLSLTKRSNI